MVFVMAQVPQILAVFTKFQDIFLNKCFFICCMPFGHFPENLSGWFLKTVFTSYAYLLRSKSTELLMLPSQKWNSLSFIFLITLFVLIFLSFVLDAVKLLENSLAISHLDLKSFQMKPQQHFSLGLGKIRLPKNSVLHQGFPIWLVGTGMIPSLL